MVNHNSFLKFLKCCSLVLNQGTIRIKTPKLLKLHNQDSLNSVMFCKVPQQCMVNKPVEIPFLRFQCFYSTLNGVTPIFYCNREYFFREYGMLSLIGCYGRFSPGGVWLPHCLTSTVLNCLSPPCKRNTAKRLCDLRANPRRLFFSFHA